MDHFELTLVASYPLAPAVRHYTFVRSDGARQPFIPGQFVQVHFQHEGVTLRRSYSIATQADEQGAESVELAVSFVPGGAATALFEGLAPGDRIQATGPNGRLVLQDGDQNQRYLLVATGTGVTPYRSMLPLIRRRIAERGQRFVLLFGKRRELVAIRRLPKQPRASSSVRAFPAPVINRNARTSGMVMSRMHWPNWRRPRNRTSPTCAGIPTWSMPRSKH
jgi:ferredoxin-NADP reductase